jgi:glutaredoxin
MLKLYTQPNCPFCDIMKSILDETIHTYQIINIKEDPESLNFIKEQGHKTVPQLYYYNVHINKKTDTREYTSAELHGIINDVINQYDWPFKDSGIEQGI